MRLSLKALAGFLILVVSMLVLVIALDEAGGETIIVAKDGNGDYKTIQYAIDNATSGDTIRVWEGTYDENVVIDKTISLIGNGSANTTIDGEGKYDMMNITADRCNITGFEITGSGRNRHDAGLKVISNHNNITGNTFQNSNCGIYLFDSDYNTLSNNVIQNNNDGFLLHSSNSNTIALNSISSNQDYGIDSVHSFNNILTDNIFTNNEEFSILLTFSDNNSIINNKAMNNNNGLYIADSVNITLINNSMADDGILITGYLMTHWNTHTIGISNTINGRPVYYWKNQTGGTVPSGAGVVILANCTGVIVENQNISIGTVGITLGFSNDCTVRNNDISNNFYYGLFLGHSDNNILMNNIATSNRWSGILLQDSAYNTLEKNSVSNNEYGIALRDSDNNTLADNNVHSNTLTGISLYHSDNNTLRNNEATSNIWYGIHLQYSNYNILCHNILSRANYGIRLNFCDNNTLMNNTCSNTTYGISLSQHDVYKIGNLAYETCSLNLVSHNTIFNTKYGIHIWVSFSNMLIYNNISNSQYGINFLDTTRNILINNSVSNNGYGFFLKRSDTNTIYHNIITNNNNQAYDDGNNQWDNGYPLGGNYWSDYEGVDEYGGLNQNQPGSDGIGDSRYTIKGGSNIDDYPLMKLNEGVEGDGNEGDDTADKDMNYHNIVGIIIIAILGLIIVITIMNDLWYPRLKKRIAMKKQEGKVEQQSDGTGDGEETREEEI